MTDIVSGGLPAGTITAHIGPPRQAALSMINAGGGGFAFTAGSTGTKELAGWHPLNRSADGDVLQTRDRILARSRDLDRNDGWAFGGADKRADAVVGSNIRLRAKPDFAAMGMSAEWADEWARKTEALFRCWANDSRFLNDVERHQHFGMQVRLAYQHYSRDGAACAPLYFLDRGGMFSTAVLVLDPIRLSNPDGKPDGRIADGAEFRGGVELDRYGAARAYHVLDGHPNDYTSFDRAKWTRIPRETTQGRPLFVHAFNKRYAHQHHGVTRIASIMPSLKTLGRYEQMEVAAAIAHATFGLYVTSPFDSDFVREAMAPAEDGDEMLSSYQAMRMAYHEQADVTLDGIRLAHLFPNEKVETISGSRSGTHFEAFSRGQLRRIASAYGLSYEQLSNDWANINYSSARTLLNEANRGFLSERHTFTQTYCTPIYAAWLEEAVARDLVEVPGGKAMFYVFRTALTQCEWIGTGRGWIDPKKEAEAAEIRMRLGLSSQTDECAEQGKDAAEVRWQRKRDLEEDRKYGLVAAEPAQGDAGGGNDDDDGDPDNQDRRERREAAGELE